MRKFKYEVGIYNKEVRDLMQTGQKHRQLRDEWADVHWIEVTAEDERDARARIHARYPTEYGYVVTAVQLLKE